MTFDAEATKTKLREWIARKSKRDASTIDDEVNLIEEGILSSLDVLEFILFLESIGGKTGRLKAGVFKNINTIFITFFTQKSHA
jgi:hypothetical protein